MMQQQQQYIGVFDSGYGGLTVLKEIAALLPSYDFMYLGDNARAPYGPLDFDTVYKYTLQAVQWFFNQGCHLVILACNTASAKALRTIQQNDLPHLAPHKRVLGVIRPTSEVINQYTKTNHVGILATNGTVQSASYLLEIKKLHPQIVVAQEASPAWVDLVESGAYNTPMADGPVQYHVNNLLQKDASIDCLLLACTHYPLLINKIKTYTPQHVTVLSQGNIVAESLVQYLQKHPEIDAHCSKNGERKFFTTGNTIDFDNHASVFFGETIVSTQVKI
ncbi:glutamate racemase [Ferruginibacter yonginensis]|uniref:Glutamate racemase n=1 Tax=Ferruginibacter yonginensis TaxID=1310416 RepID=A0ABV8QSV2_9BACT